MFRTVGGVQYRGEISRVPWGDFMNTMGDTFSIMEDVQYRGDILSTVGEYHEYRGVLK